MAAFELKPLEGQFIHWQSLITNLLGPDAEQPICDAIHNGNEQRVRELSSQLQGAPMIISKREAIVRGRSDLLRILLENDKTVSEDLVAAASDRRDKGCVSTLLDFGWPIDRPVYFAASILCLAIDDAGFMQWLIEKGADINAKSNLDETVLAMAISKGSMKVVQLLLEQGADLTHGNLLHCAAERKNHSEGAELVQHLMRNGAHVNAYRYDNPIARRFRGMSQLLLPLHVACYEQNTYVAKVLLQNGADPLGLVLEQGQMVPPTALEIAFVNCGQEMVDLLSNYTPK
ncbi:hypothetical protein LTR37_015932 [Vermiconidia calcicola]|uniref:Uncharacterized protein n=1 Tax=Vermiconidia calcicola TaxID=1690605 RepID=A0ACC3MPE8_9PEZI|nr:hypothetical protein LTR37_015932 [Vermiconidia calcicola]